MPAANSAECGARFAREEHGTKSTLETDHFRRLCALGSPEEWVAALDDTLEKRNVLLGYVNTHTAYLSKTDKSYRMALRDFLLLNDGVGLDAVSRIKYGERFESNLNGSDFTPLFLQTTRHRFRVFLLGGKEGVAQAAADALRGVAPQHSYVGHHRGHLTQAEEGEVVWLIRASGANVVLVGFGNPDQEMWIARHCRELEVPLIIGVGALLDFLAGAVPQAPGWMQRARLEWAYRLLREPRRLWKRYLWFTPLLILQSIAERGRARWLSVVAAFLLMDVELVTSSE